MPRAVALPRRQQTIQGVWKLLSFGAKITLIENMAYVIEVEQRERGKEAEEEASRARA